MTPFSWKTFWPEAQFDFDYFFWDTDLTDLHGLKKTFTF